jgi:hypothetical protein
MNKQYTDNDILDILAKTSAELAPHEQSFAVTMKRVLAASNTASDSASTKLHSKKIVGRIHSPYTVLMRVSGAFAAICLLYVGVTGLRTPVSVPKTGSVAIESSTVQNILNTDSASTKATPTESKLAVAAKSVISEDVTALTSALENELTAEVGADAALFAISE